MGTYLEDLAVALRERRALDLYLRSRACARARQTSSESVSGGRPIRRVPPIWSSIFTYSAVKRVFGSCVTTWS
ncbi:hypothetical protein BX281_0330 [Streptomyces sp. Ag82_O1-15]|jgi:hypothetical protein|nr:hypothetical protein BX281_0330 [Streptomyces sp. Ag82_O1-15]